MAWWDGRQGSWSAVVWLMGGGRMTYSRVAQSLGRSAEVHWVVGGMGDRLVVAVAWWWMAGWWWDDRHAGGGGLVVLG